MRMRPLTVLAAVAMVALAIPSSARAAGVDPSNATAVQREQAQQKFFRGKALLAQKKYDDAANELRASLEIVASPNSRLLLARCLREQGHLVEAYVEFGRAVVEAKELARADARYAKAGESAAEDRAALEPKLAFVTLAVSHAADDTKLRVGSEELRRAAWSEPVPVMPGATDIVVESPGRAPVKQTVTLAAGEKKSIAIDAGASAAESTEVAAVPHAPPADDNGAKKNRTALRPYAYVAGGIGAAGLITFGVFGALANSTYGDLKDQCHGPCAPPRASDISTGKTQQTIANIGLVVGAIGLGAGVALFIISAPTKSEEAPPQAAVVVGPGWLGIRGSM
jgi:hypothetical protein